MKKYFYSVLAASMLFACSQEEIVDVNKSESQLKTFKVELPANVTSRTAGGAIGAGTQADQLIYAMYEHGVENAPVLVSGIETDGEDNDGTFTVTVPMAKDIKYDLLFLAYNPSYPAFEIASTPDSTNLKALKFNAGQTPNVDAYDAFVGFLANNGVNETKTVTLKRPFAQINAATTSQDLQDAARLEATVKQSKLVITGVPTTYNVLSEEATGSQEVTYAPTDILNNETITVDGTTYTYLTLAYVLAGEGSSNHEATFEFFRENDNNPVSTLIIPNLPIQRNYRTNVVGSLVTKNKDFEIKIDNKFAVGENNVYNDQDQVYAKVTSAEEFGAAFENAEFDVIVLEGDINLNDLASRAAKDTSLTIAAGRTLTIDLNDKKLSATSSETGKNYNMFDVRGTLTVKNGTMEYEHVGENMGWNSSTNLFNVTAGGVLNLEGVTATNKGGSDMGFVAHLNNWGEVTLNVNNCTLESNYVPVRVFNSGYDMNNVTIKNSTLKGGSAAFWVHNYTVEDFGSAAKAEAQKALLNFNIYNQGNTFSPDLNGIRYGFTNSVRADAYGITKTVSEDGTVVTLGSMTEDGLVRRGVAGAEENTTIKKAIVGEGVTTLYDRTFRRFYALETVELPSTLTTIGAAGSGVFQSCNALKNIVIPESVTVLGEGTFQECTSLTSINVPSGVTRIEKNVFRNTGLTSIEFHSGVTYFGEYAFRDCEELTEIIINAPQFTVESNTFLNAAGPFPSYTIHVANAEMKVYLESMLTAHQKTFIHVVAPEVIDNTAALQAALAEGKNVTLAGNLTISAAEMLTAPYGNKTALSHNGGVFDGNGKTISVTIGGDNYAVMTNGGTIKNLTIDNGFRGIVIMSANQTVYLDNVVSSGEGVCYALNTAEGDSTQDLVATNCTFNGWSSWSLLKSATFTKCKFGQGTYYTNVYGRLGKPYVNTLFDGCEFCSKFYIDLSALGADQKVTLKNCTVNGVKITAENWTSLVAPEDTCGEGQISVELKNGTYLTANNVADYIVFE